MKAVLAVVLLGAIVSLSACNKDKGASEAEAIGSANAVTIVPANVINLLLSGASMKETWTRLASSPSGGTALPGGVESRSGQNVLCQSQPGVGPSAPVYCAFQIDAAGTITAGAMFSQQFLNLESNASEDQTYDANWVYVSVTGRAATWIYGALPASNDPSAAQKKVGNQIACALEYGVPNPILPACHFWLTSSGQAVAPR